MSETLETLLAEASRNTEACLVEPIEIAAGGVDPLGLRQINFDLMDRVIPGLNNVARHIRPFTFMTWSWRRAKHVIGTREADPGVVRNFVDRLETVFAWSQFLVDARVDLPGSQALAPLLSSSEYTFGGDQWEKLRDVRRYSTGIAAPVNYGPALRSMHWIGDTGKPGVFKPNPEFDRMAEEFEASFAGELEHPLFNTFDPVSVTAEAARRWGKCWNLSAISEAERAAAYEALCGRLAPKERRAGVRLIRAAAAALASRDVNEVRRLMSETSHSAFTDEELQAAAGEWRRVQVRQVFRLALEAMLRWICLELIDRSAATQLLADEFLDRVFSNATCPNTTAEWLSTVADSNENPVERLAQLRAALENDADVERNIASALLYCLSIDSIAPDVREIAERLPLWRAKAEFEAVVIDHPRVWLCHVIEAWVLAQHLFWSVGRALADARGGGKTLLRLRVTMEESGWTLLPGASAGSMPEATPDRLATVISLLYEAGELYAGA